jgi:hypothetical protein
MKLVDAAGVMSLLDFYIANKYPKGVVLVTHPEDCADIYWGCLGILTVDDVNDLCKIVTDDGSGMPKLRGDKLDEQTEKDLGDYHGGVDIYIDGEKYDASIDENDMLVLKKEICWVLKKEEK